MFLYLKNQYIENGTLPKTMQSLSNYPKVFFTELEQIITQFVWKHKRPWLAKAILKKKSGTSGINLPDFIL